MSVKAGIFLAILFLALIAEAISWRLKKAGKLSPVLLPRWFEVLIVYVANLVVFLALGFLVGLMWDFGACFGTFRQCSTAFSTSILVIPMAVASLLSVAVSHRHVANARKRI